MNCNFVFKIVLNKYVFNWYMTKNYFKMIRFNNRILYVSLPNFTLLKNKHNDIENYYYGK